MDYSNIYEEISFHKLQKLWWKNNDVLQVYVHNPFCKSMCKYCFYKGVNFNKTAYKRYYYEYLPRVISMYYEILKRKKTVAYFFGGGTPSIMTPDTMRHIFALFPSNFKKNRQKIFEIHPGVWSVGQLDVLKEYNFKFLLIGVQTFNRNTLIKQNRVPHSFDDVHDIVAGAKKRNIFSAIDLIAFLNKKESDLKIIKRDIDKSISLSVDEISIQNDYRLKGPNKRFDDLLVDYIFNLKEVKSKKYVPQLTYDEYKMNFHDMKCLRLLKRETLKRDRNLFQFINGMDELTNRQAELNLSVLGIGSYGNKRKNTFSNIGNTLEYIEINKNWKPHFFIVYQPDFYRDMTTFVERVKKLGQPPAGTIFSISNSIIIDNNDTLYRKPRELDIRVSVKKRKENMLYVDKLQKALSGHELCIIDEADGEYVELFPVQTKTH